MRKAAAIAIILLSLLLTEARKHHLEIRNDARKFFPISTFGFYMGGFLSVNVTGFTADSINDSVIGFTIDRTTNDALNPYVETSETKCVLDKPIPTHSSTPTTLHVSTWIKVASCTTIPKYENYFQYMDTK